MSFEDFKIGQEYQIVKDILIMGNINVGQRNAFFPKGVRLIVHSVNPESRIVGFVEKNSGVGLDLYPNHWCIRESLHLVEDVQNITLIPV